MALESSLKALKLNGNTFYESLVSKNSVGTFVTDNQHSDDISARGDLRPKENNNLILCEERENQDTKNYMEVFENSLKENESSKEALFDPPLYKQRYAAVTDIIRKYRAKTVIDMGCSEGQFLNYVKNFCSTVEFICGIDIDKELLERDKRRIAPLTIEYILKRQRPLNVCLYHGSITDFDDRFTNVDVLACIEVIEHLYDETLKQVPANIFGKMKPKICVITTPNKEYNVLFDDFEGMRHWDHKFEWTRNEFETWCENIELNFEYECEISGVGLPPVGSKVGYCSQMAIFKRRDFLMNWNEDLSSSQRSHNSTNLPKRDDTNRYPFKFIHAITYPFEDIETNCKELFLNEVEYIINHFYCIDITDEESVGDIITIKIKLSELLGYPGIKRLNLEFKRVLEYLSSKYELDCNKEMLIVKIDKEMLENPYFYEDDEMEENMNDNYFDNDVTVNYADQFQTQSLEIDDEETEDWGL